MINANRASAKKKRLAVKRNLKSGPTEKVGGWNAGMTTALVLGLLSCGATLGAAVIGADDKAKTETVVSCPTELDKALEVRRENPTVDITYTGEIETQCELNSAIRQIPAPAPVPLPAP